MRPESRPDTAIIIGDKIEFRPDPAAPPSQLVQTLARTLRRLRDRQRAERGTVALSLAKDDAGQSEDLK